MPPKIKFSSDDIIGAAFTVVRKQGFQTLSTRSIAKELSASTMPIYTYLKSKQNLEQAIIKKAFELLFSYQITPRTGDLFLDMGIGYVLFAKEEKHLFRCLNDERHQALNKKFHEQNVDSLTCKLSDHPLVKGASQDEIRQFFLQGWTYSHGLATLINNAFYADIDEKEITELLMYTGLRYMEGFKMLRGNGRKISP